MYMVYVAGQLVGSHRKPKAANEQATAARSMCSGSISVVVITPGGKSIHF